MTIAVTIFPNLRGVTADEVQVTPEQIVDLIRTARADRKENLPLIKCARFGFERSPQGALRHDRNMVAITGIEGDYDGEEVDPQDAVERLREHDIEAIVYTSPSHKPMKPRWRVICPLSREYPAMDRDTLVSRLNGALGGILEPESFTRSQSYFFGSVDEPVQTWTTKGAKIDQRPDLPTVGPHPKSLISSAPSGKIADLLKRQLTQPELAHILGRMPNRSDTATDAPWWGRTAWVELAHAIHGCTGGAQWAREAFVAWSAQYDGDMTEPERVWDTIRHPKAGFGTLQRMYDAWAGEGQLRRELAPIELTVHDAAPQVAAAPHRLTATPFRFPDPTTIPPRQWLYGRHLIRKFVSCTISPGGIGKSTLKAAEAVAMASGKPLLGVAVHKPLRVWLWNLEDPQEETMRKLAAIRQHYGLSQEDIEGRLFVDSGRETPLCIARMHDGVAVVEPQADDLMAEIAARQIDVVIVDPFVSSHKVSENDNNAIDVVAKEWGRIADKCGVAVDLVHHTRKGNGAESNADSARGAKALVDAARDVEVLNQMTDDEAAKLDVQDNHRLYFRVISDKMNLAPPAEKSRWYRLTSTDLPNGTLEWECDHVGVPVPWQPVGPLHDVPKHLITQVLNAIEEGVPGTDDLYTHYNRGGTPRWVGRLVVDIMGKSEQSAGAVIKLWMGCGLLLEGEFMRDRKLRKGVKVDAKIRSEMGV
jgi:hypothetical protein